jgi:hypothetical protein
MEEAMRVTIKNTTHGTKTVFECPLGPIYAKPEAAWNWLKSAAIYDRNKMKTLLRCTRELCPTPADQPCGCGIIR